MRIHPGERVVPRAERRLRVRDDPEHARLLQGASPSPSPSRPSAHRRPFSRSPRAAPLPPDVKQKKERPPDNDRYVGVEKLALQRAGPHLRRVQA
ncbi:hypothetical protein NUW54_g763 [Trametes sanguinea]|uniref:Uncharacterized protein n=1 Tax=Trametes sanguinea TaxID=158606 RepID=A0ACC1QC43_9APHY|nr:hypothetical protein NUW54_g763 [Trametes sanguinea]